MPRSDVTRAARSTQDAVHQRLTPAAKLAAAIDMSDFARQLAEAGARARNPAASDAEIRQLLIDALYGDRRRSR